MTPTAETGQLAPLLDERVMATSREQFLTRETPPPHTVRGPILASWQRSQDLRVAADRIEMSYEPDVRLDSSLSRSALPVLKALREQLMGQSVSVVLTDPTGLVLTRMTGDTDLENHLDKVLLAPGFSYAEKYVGTNGIGTALEMGGPAHVFGHEHYAEHLEDLACAGVPIHHPITSRVVGAVDLTCWRKDAGALLLTLAKTTAEQIKQSLLAEAASGELALFREYLRICRRTTGIVFALNKDVVMLNDYARSVLEPLDQATLLACAGDALTSGHRGPLVVALPSGQTARMHWRAVTDESPVSGLVAHVKLERPPTPTPAREVRSGSPAPLPGLVGSGPAWLNACQDIERAFRSDEWLAVEGEPGVGKLAVLTSVQLRRQPIGRFLVLDASMASADPAWLTKVQEAIAGAADSLVIRHVDTLDARGLRNLHSTLITARDGARERPLWVAVTLGRPHPSTELTRLLNLFPTSVEVPPLRMHKEDLQALVSLFLARLSHGGHLACSPEAMRLLMRMELPGNGEQVHQLLREVVRHRRTGRIEPADLPPEAHTVSRRVLTSLEAMERDAIVTCLAEVGGNKARAAQSLGMSRATIYRKIHGYGIIVEPQGGPPSQIATRRPDVRA